MNNLNKQFVYDRLDTYRFISVSLVLISHWCGFVKNYFRIGELGVIMFFVLSGFLITNSLNFSKSKKNNTIKVLLNFYVRRTLRISPLYFLVLFFFFYVFDDLLLKSNFKYFVFYGVNFLVLELKQWPSYFSHFWSLSFEEQFYIFWPVIILPVFYRISFLKRVLFLYFVLIIYLFLKYDEFNNDFFLMNPLFSSLAIISGSLITKIICLKHKIDNIIIPFLVIILLLVSTYFLKFSYYYNILFLIISILFSMSLVIYLVSRQLKIRSLFWDNLFFKYLGKISYGIYLLHNFLPFLFSFFGLNRQDYLDGSIKGYLIYYILFPFFYLIFTIILSHITFKYFENPINSLKRYFP